MGRTSEAEDAGIPGKASIHGVELEYVLHVPPVAPLREVQL